MYSLFSKLVFMCFWRIGSSSAWTKYWLILKYGQNRLPNRWTLSQTCTKQLLRSYKLLWKDPVKYIFVLCFHSTWYNQCGCHFLLFSISIKTFSNCWSLTPGKCQDSKLDILHSTSHHNIQDPNVSVFIIPTFTPYHNSHGGQISQMIDTFP